MKESKFTELVNLYFDQEISSVEIKLLREVLAVCPVRKADFESRYRLHQAMRIAVAPEALKAAEFRILAAKNISQVSRLTALILGFGITACVSAVFILLRPVIQEVSSVAAIGEQTEMLQSDMKRFATNSGLDGARRGSLASQLRLVGLTPELVPLEPQLSSLDLEALLQREAQRQLAIDRINRYRAYSVIPEQQFLEPLQQPARDLPPQQRWPAGFQNSLASFYPLGDVCRLGKRLFDERFDTRIRR